MFEDPLLERLSIDAALHALSAPERDVMRMVFAYEQPDEYDGPWPPTLTTIGVYVGLRYYGKRLNEGRIAKMRDTVLARWKYALAR